MSWHYQARRKTVNNETIYELVEAYPELRDNGITPHTLDAVTVCADSKEELVKWLRIAADDVEKYDVIDGDN